MDNGSQQGETKGRERGWEVVTKMKWRAEGMGGRAERVI